MKLASRLLALTTLTAAILSVTTIAHAAPREQDAAKSVPAFPALTSIYRFTGLVTTSIDPYTGVQVAAHCTNWHASQNRSVRYIFRRYTGGTVATAGPFVLTPFRTFTLSTQFTDLFDVDKVVVPTSPLDQGSLEIFASGPEVHCSAQLVDAAATDAANVVTLAGTRINQEGAAQE
jgi:hypothetical protein